MMRGLSDIELENVISQMFEDISEPQSGIGSNEFGIIEVGGEISADRFRTFGPAEGSSMTAVDGGSATILDAGSFIIAGVRVGRAFYSDRKYVNSGEPEFHLLRLSVNDLENVYSIFFSKIGGTDPPDAPRGLDEAVGRIRTLLEWKQVETVLAGDLAPGSLVVFDGALWAGIKGIGAQIARIVKTAR